MSKLTVYFSFCKPFVPLKHHLRKTESHTNQLSMIQQRISVFKYIYIYVYISVKKEMIYLYIHIHIRSTVTAINFNFSMLVLRRNAVQ